MEYFTLKINQWTILNRVLNPIVIQTFGFYVQYYEVAIWMGFVNVKIVQLSLANNSFFFPPCKCLRPLFLSFTVLSKAKRS